MNKMENAYKNTESSIADMWRLIGMLVTHSHSLGSGLGFFFCFLAPGCSSPCQTRSERRRLCG